MGARSDADGFFATLPDHTTARRQRAMFGAALLLLLVAIALFAANAPPGERRSFLPIGVFAALVPVLLLNQSTQLAKARAHYEAARDAYD